jgi:hypothetical protein
MLFIIFKVKEIKMNKSISVNKEEINQTKNHNHSQSRSTETQTTNSQQD